MDAGLGQRRGPGRAVADGVDLGVRDRAQLAVDADETGLVKTEAAVALPGVGLRAGGPDQQLRAVVAASVTCSIKAGAEPQIDASLTQGATDAALRARRQAGQQLGALAQQAGVDRASWTGLVEPMAQRQQRLDAGGACAHRAQVQRLVVR